MMEPLPLHRLLQELECYLQDEIGDLMGQGYQMHPGSTLENLHKLLDSCIQWQQKLKSEQYGDSSGGH